VLPPTNDKRKERYGQYKDFGLFLGAIAVVAYFQDDIKKVFDIDVEQYANLK
jgi:hypothetical protein